MKKSFVAFCMAACLLLLSGCQSPNRLQLDLSQGYGDNLKLLHLNVISEENEQRIEAFSQVVRDAEPLDKPMELFAYYPDYMLEITPWDENGALTVIIDVNGDYIDFYYPGPNPAADNTIYRSHTTAEEFFQLVNQS
jgi:hypothetical protein